jgi:hypothetical protein
MPVPMPESDRFEYIGVPETEVAIPFTREQLFTFETEHYQMLVGNGVDEAIAQEIAKASIAPLKAEMEVIYAKVAR